MRKDTKVNLDMNILRVNINDFVIIMIERYKIEVRQDNHRQIKKLMLAFNSNFVLHQ